VSYWMRCSAWVCRLWLAVVLGSCVVSSVHTAHDTAPHNHSQHNQCSSTRSYSTDDAHNDARNMLRWKFDNKHRISCILLVLSLHLMFTMHGHRNLKHDMIYLLTAIGLTPGGSSTVHIYTQTIHRTKQLTTRTTQVTTELGRVGAVPGLWLVIPWHLPYN